MSKSPKSARKPRYWLMKSEPDVYSIDDLARDKSTPWTGVRNYQARNFMRDEMQVGDLVLFYHSNAEPSGAAGVGRVVREAYPDPTARDPRSEYFDPKATDQNPIWMMVDVGYVRTFKTVVSLDRMRTEPDLAGMLVLKRGMRLSVQPVTEAEFERVCVFGGSSK